uniref:Class II aldolase/adducin N-terminal domain-containing protein n=1 Tax=Ditylenchus dipsaci TaxID=166011 RepID=A0A915DDB2_9BILA
MPRNQNGGVVNGISSPSPSSCSYTQSTCLFSHTLPTTNGSKVRPERSPTKKLLADRDDPEYIKELQRPAAIQEDLSEMGRRKRVQQVLDSKDFCSELEERIKDRPDTTTTDTRSNLDPDYMTSSTLQRLSHMTLPSQSSGNIMSSINLHSLSSTSCLIPIADLSGTERYCKQERMARNKLASLYRLVDQFQWSQGIYNHITLRLTEESDIKAGKPVEVLINPFGLLYHEITASSLIKIGLDGEVLDGGSTRLGVNQAGYVLHSAIHEARPDVKCVLHLHTSVVSAVSSMKCGLLPICQEAMIIGPIAYHDYQGIVSEEEEKRSIVEDLGDKNVLLLRTTAFHMIVACETQIRAARAGIENLVIPDEKAVKQAYITARRGGGGVNRLANDNSKGTMSNSYSEGGGWRIGELEWEAWMRVLDSAGYRTGHIYRQPQLKSLNHGHLSTASNSTIEQLETGTDRPKVITKWVQDFRNPSSNNGTPVKIASAHQFSPFGTDPKEFKQTQKRLKETRLSGSIGAGPRSQVLDGLTHDEIANDRQESEANNHGTRDQHFVVLGTASKGIIDRDYQHNAQVYRSLYAPNPFASETDENIKKYIKDMEIKSRSTSALETINGNASPPTIPYNHHVPDSPDNISLMQASRHSLRNQPPESGSVDQNLANDTQIRTSEISNVNGKIRTKSATSPKKGEVLEDSSMLITVFDDAPDKIRTMRKPLKLVQTVPPPARAWSAEPTRIGMIDRSMSDAEPDYTKEEKKKKRGEDFSRLDVGSRMLKSLRFCG